MICILQLVNSFVFPFLLILCSDLGVHVDGFIANVAHSFIVGASKVKKQKSRHVYISHLGHSFVSSHVCPEVVFFCFSICRRTPSQAGKLM